MKGVGDNTWVLGQLWENTYERLGLKRQAGWSLGQTPLKALVDVTR